MTTLLDTNVIIALWDNDPAVNGPARLALENALARGALAINGVVYGELLGYEGREEEFLERFLAKTGITVEWDLDEPIWRTAGRAFQAYASRRARSGSSKPRRILPDFLIGAHASKRGYTLLTLDLGHFRAAFPDMRIFTA